LTATLPGVTTTDALSSAGRFLGARSGCHIVPGVALPEIGIVVTLIDDRGVDPVHSLLAAAPQREPPQRIPVDRRWCRHRCRSALGPGCGRVPQPGPRSAYPGHGRPPQHLSGRPPVGGDVGRPTSPWTPGRRPG
jgi:hypothetical protein